jgi:hypothetical protein
LSFQTFAKITRKQSKNTLNPTEKNILMKNLSKRSSFKKHTLEKDSSKKDSLEENTANELALEEQNTSEINSLRRERSKKSNPEYDLVDSKDATTSQISLDQIRLFSAIPEAPCKLDKDRKKILKLLAKNPMNWEHRCNELNLLEHAMLYSDLSVITYLLRLNPPRRIMQKGLIRGFWYRHMGFELLLTKDTSLMDDIPEDYYQKVKDELMQDLESDSIYIVGQAMASELNERKKTVA